MNCLSCPSVSGEKRISPGPVIFEGKYWIVDHAYPTHFVGWLVIVLKRHCEAMHELTPTEFAELAELQQKIIRLFHEVLHTDKEYVALFAEAPGFEHLHCHVIPRTREYPAEYRGAKAFALLKVEEEDPAIRQQVIEMSEKFKQAWT